MRSCADAKIRKTTLSRPPCLGTLRACAQLVQRVARGTLPALWAHLSQPNNTPRLLLRQQLPSLLPSSHDLRGKQIKQGDSALRDSKSRALRDLRGGLQSPPSRSCAAGRQVARTCSDARHSQGSWGGPSLRVGCPEPNQNNPGKKHSSKFLLQKSAGLTRIPLQNEKKHHGAKASILPVGGAPKNPARHGVFGR